MGEQHMCPIWTMKRFGERRRVRWTCRWHPWRGWKVGRSAVSPERRLEGGLAPGAGKSQQRQRYPAPVGAFPGDVTFLAENVGGGLGADGDRDQRHRVLRDRELASHGGRIE